MFKVELVNFVILVLIFFFNIICINVYKFIFKICFFLLNIILIFKMIYLVSVFNLLMKY